jgi:hypothetical protein
MITAKIRAALILTPFLASLSACSDAELLYPVEARAQFARVGPAKEASLPGHYWGGLMSSKRLLEEYLREEPQAFPVGNLDAGGGLLWIGSYSLEGPSWLTNVQVNILETEQIDQHLEIPFRLEGYGTIMFYCEHSFGDDYPQPTFYYPMPFVATGRLLVNLPESTFRNAADFRAWLAASLGWDIYVDYLFNDAFVITYDENCVPTQVLP